MSMAGKINSFLFVILVRKAKKGSGLMWVYFTLQTCDLFKTFTAYHLEVSSHQPHAIVFLSIYTGTSLNPKTQEMTKFSDSGISGLQRYQ